MSLQSTNPFAALRNFTAKAPQVERCELCGKQIGAEHQHLLEPATRKLTCACDACAILFSGDATMRYRRVPKDIEVLADFQISDEQWEGLHLPIQLAFFYESTVAKRVVAMFPSPAGATESLLPEEAWQDLVYANPVLLEMKPDVEALLVNRVGELREYTRAPIDECFRLVGILRMHWRGLSGGTEVWRHINAFGESLRTRAVNGECGMPKAECGRGGGDDAGA